MNERLTSALADRALLPEGLHDDLPPAAEHQAAVAQRLLDHFAAHGYLRVSPPLVEFEDSLLAGAGAAQSRHMFRLMDPVSQRMMGVRADMTLQVARIAATRLGHWPRPLRLSYGGPVLRVKGTQLRPEREFYQMGAELVGCAAVTADVEVILMAASALSAVPGLSVDLTLPTLAALVCAGLGLDEGASAQARIALNGKDIGALAGLPPAAGQVLRALLSAAGPAARALAALRALALGGEAGALVARLADAVSRISAANPALALTIDPAEHRGFDYESGIAFTLFGGGIELGRGGRYGIEMPAGPETATGFSVYLDSLIQALPAPAAPELVYAPFGAVPHAVAALRAQGRRVLAGLEPEPDPAQAARDLKCSHILTDAGVVDLPEHASEAR